MSGLLRFGDFASTMPRGRRAFRMGEDAILQRRMRFRGISRPPARREF